MPNQRSWATTPAGFTRPDTIEGIEGRVKAVIDATDGTVHCVEFWPDGSDIVTLHTLHQWLVADGWHVHEAQLRTHDTFEAHNQPFSKGGHTRALSIYTQIEPPRTAPFLLWTVNWGPCAPISDT